MTRDVSVSADVTLGPDGVRVRGTTPLNLKDYKIGGLTKMLGMLKMHEEIVVHVDLVFAPAAAPAGRASSCTPSTAASRTSSASSSRVPIRRYSATCTICSATRTRCTSR